MLPLLFIVLWAIYSVPGALVSLPIVLFSKQVKWYRWELLTLVLPFAVWTALMLSDLSTGVKSLSNMVVEPFIMASIPVVGALARRFMAGRVDNLAAARITLAGTCFLAGVVFWLVPSLPE